MTTRAYSWDVERLNELGLGTGPWEHGERSHLGAVEGEDWKIEVYVTALPAQFWEFHIRRADQAVPGATEQLVMRTGSGGFTTYWPIAREVARNMVTLTKLGEAPAGHDAAVVSDDCERLRMHLYMTEPGHSMEESPLFPTDRERLARVLDTAEAAVRRERA